MRRREDFMAQRHLLCENKTQAQESSRSLIFLDYLNFYWFYNLKVLLILLLEDALYILTFKTKLE